ncbi:MAG: 2-dehydro-3-deoxygluconokinase [Chloroflexi bacterium ADurb.Bin360]|nr:MAG: 2-dehydro-3-deoxygluconokinase [Chloroflexi bacterium ADurb.Bin360]
MADQHQSAPAVCQCVFQTLNGNQVEMVGGFVHHNQPRLFEQAQGKLISLDPNYSPRIWPDFDEARRVIRHMMGYTTFTKPSLDDAQRIFGTGKTPEDYITLFHEMGPRVVVLTMGGAGMILSVEGRQTFIPAQPVKIVDATGAGDSFWAGFLVALLDGNPLERCVLFAREIVGRKLVRMGPLPDTIDRDEVYRAIGR